MPRRRLRALQVEVSSRCTRHCAVCPRSVLADRWLDGDLSPELWRRLLPDLELVEHVHLQGWGEPLLHPALPSMVRDAAAAGCRVGLTTNGELLRGAADWILASPLDVLAVSVAGCDESNARLRDGVLIGELLEVLAELARSRRSRRRHRLHLAYLLTRETAGELAEVVAQAAAAGVDEVIVSHLDVAPTPELRELAAYSGGAVLPEVRDPLRAAEATALRHRIELHTPYVEAQEMLVCDLDPRRSLSVRWDGRVAPCVSLNLPIRGPVPRATGAGVIEVEPPVLGWLSRESLRDILEGEAYGSFVDPFHRRMVADARYREWGLLASGWGVVALNDLDRVYGELEASLQASPFPDACSGCPKAHGW